MRTPKREREKREISEGGKGSMYGQLRVALVFTFVTEEG